MWGTRPTGEAGLVLRDVIMFRTRIIVSLGLGMATGLLVLLGLPAPAESQVTFTVNSTADGADSNLADGVCDDGTGHCTLRAAIQQANATPGHDVINFSIGTGMQTIRPASRLPDITDPVTIDGSTQPGFSGRPIIELSGASAGAPGLLIFAGDSTIQGVVINRFTGDGIALIGHGNNTI